MYCADPYEAMLSNRMALAAKAETALDVDGIVSGCPRVVADAREVNICLNAAKQASRTLLATGKVSKTGACGGVGG